MPLKVEQCVQKLLKSGKKKSDSYAICYSQNKKGKKTRKMKRK